MLFTRYRRNIPDSKVYGANMGPTQVGSMLAPCTLLSGMLSDRREPFQNSQKPQKLRTQSHF